VAPEAFPDEVATARASGAADLLESARVVDTLAKRRWPTRYFLPRDDGTARELALPACRRATRRMNS
jgi:tRNA/rRNA methyltransferase